MKALSLRQPWAWAVLHAGKRVENRRWWTSYRGPILLHAAKGCTREEYVAALESMTVSGLLDDLEWPPLETLPRGGIVGRARIVDMISSGLDREVVAQNMKHHKLDLRWWMPEQYGFVLADVEPLPFKPWPGALGLFEVPADYAAREPPPRATWGAR